MLLVRVKCFSNNLTSVHFWLSKQMIKIVFEFSLTCALLCFSVYKVVKIKALLCLGFRVIKVVQSIFKLSGTQDLCEILSRSVRKPFTSNHIKTSFSTYEISKIDRITVLLLRDWIIVNVKGTFWYESKDSFQLSSHSRSFFFEWAFSDEEKANRNEHVCLHEKSWLLSNTFLTN